MNTQKACMLMYLHASLLTPAEQVVPHEMLFLCKHCHYNQCVQVNALTQHPEVVTAQQIQIDERQQLTAFLEEENKETP